MESYNYNYNKLLGRIKELGYPSQEEFSKNINMNQATFSQKVNNKATFKQNEIKKICESLKIPVSEIGDYFFSHNVCKTQTKR